jgi:TrmH family RNA methyltransferase
VDNLSKNKIKEIRSLQQKKFRDELGLFVIEGIKMVEEAVLHFPELIDCFIHTSDYSPTFTNSSFTTFKVDAKTLGQCSSFKTPNHALIVVKKQTPNSPTNDFSLAIDGVQDPGNFGTILRLADWFGIDQIICSKETVDVYNPKVVQASMGAILRIKVHYLSLQEFFQRTKPTIYGALLEGKNVYTENLDRKGILLMGNEGNGISQELIPYITNPISIPRFGQAESLNVSVATGILLSEFSRG